MSQFGFTVDCRKRAIHQTVGDLYAANTWHISARQVNILSQISFEIGVKIHRCARINMANVRQVSGHVTGGQIEGAAQHQSPHGRNRGRPRAPALDHFEGGEIGSCPNEAVFNISC